MSSAASLSPCVSLIGRSEAAPAPGHRPQSSRQEQRRTLTANAPSQIANSQLPAVIHELLGIQAAAERFWESRRS